jgi:hypothetical protein
MYKVIFSSLMIFSAASYADNTPTFDFNTGVLNMPFVSTSQGNYTATLRINPTLPATAFNITAVGNATVANDTTTPATFNFQTGDLNLPKVNASNGTTYTASLKLVQDVFQLISATPIVQSAPGSNNIGGCSIFPANNVWNTRIDNLPLHPRSADWINTISTAGIHSDFGAPYDGSNLFGQPINIVAGSTTPKQNFTFDVPSESDQVPYPIPNNFLIENAGEPRLFIIDNETCKLYETYNARIVSNTLRAKRGATWDLKSNALRTDGWGSADEGGFPTVPGLVRYDEAASGVINHALRFTFPKPHTRIWPARHAVEPAVAGENDTLPMGARLRLKASINIPSNLDLKLKAILQAMKTYGIMLTDDGSPLYLSGTPDNRWDNDLLSQLKAVKGSLFEVVKSECMMVDPNSGEANPNKC